ncbi:MAG: hypothetical protein IKV47_07825 [Oscillospiraceae bacterium]|nr:hypothetical protein [Oscillospiraceae bacterium]
MKRSNIVSGALLCVCQMGIAGVFFSLSYIQNKFISMQINYPVLLIVLLAVYFADVIMLRRGVMLSVYTALQAVFAIGAVVLWISMVSVEKPRLWTEVSTGILYAVFVISSAVYAYTCVSARAAALWFDGACIAAAAAFLLGEYMQIPCAKETAVMSIISVASALAALVASTASPDGYGSNGQKKAPRGRLFIISAMSAVAALAILIAAALNRILQRASGAAALAMKWCANALREVLEFIYSILYAIVDALVGKIELAEAEGEAVAMPNMPGAEINYSQMDFEVPLWGYIAAGVIFAAVVAAIALGLRGVRAKSGRRLLKTVRISREKEKVQWPFFANLVAVLQYLYRRVKYRRSAAGLLDYCICRANKVFPRKTDESGPSYLIRLSKSGYAPQLSAALESLAQSVEHEFYSKKAESIAPEIYKAIHNRKHWKS